MSEMNLERADARPPTPTAGGASVHRPFDSSAPAKRMKRRYTLWCVIAPTAIFMVAFGVICARECTVLPWLTFIYAPLIALAVMVAVAAIMWFTAGNLPQDERKSVRRHILTSILWGPLAAYAGFGVTLMAVQFMTMVLSRLFS